MSKTFNLGIVPKKKNVPKLDFSGLKHNKEFKDWYKYSIKLEKSIKALRNKIKCLEDDMAECNSKNQNLRKQNSNLYTLNKKLVSNVKGLKKKIVEVKERYNKRVKKAQQFGVGALEMTIPRFETDITSDYRQDTLENKDFDDFNSNDSYDPDRLAHGLRAYKTPGLDKQHSAGLDADYKERAHTDYILEQNDYYDLNATQPKRVESPVKRIETSKLYASTKKVEFEEAKREAGSASMMYPNQSYKKSGLITKIHVNDHNRDMLAGRKKLIRKSTVEFREELQHSS